MLDVPVPQPIIPMMTSEEAVDWKARISSCANQLRLLLFEGHERRAWEALGYATWTECLKALAEEYRFSERRLWQLHAANETEQHLTEPGSVGAIPERQLRPLTGLPPEQQQEVWQEAVDTAPPSGLTAEHVQQTVTRVHGGRPHTEPTPKSSPRKELQDELFSAVKVLSDAEAWDILAMVWFELEEYYYHIPNVTESALENMMRAHNRLLPLFPQAMVEKFKLGPEWHADTPVGQECIACGEYESAGPTQPCLTCGEPVHAECVNHHDYGHTHPRRT